MEPKTINDVVKILRELSKNKYLDKELYIPENEVGINEGYYDSSKLIHFIADMMEE